MTRPVETSAARVEPFIESGEAFRRLGGLESPAVRERFDVIVIGGGQAGLSVGYYLRKRGLRFLIAGIRCVCSRPPSSTAWTG